MFLIFYKTLAIQEFYKTSHLSFYKVLISISMFNTYVIFNIYIPISIVYCYKFNKKYIILVFLELNKIWEQVERLIMKRL